MSSNNNTTGVNRAHRIADQVRSAIGWIGRTPSESQFTKKGTLTPAEFVDAGDNLVSHFPTWQWKFCTNKKYEVFWLPPGKQYLLTKNVPCRYRLKDLDKSLTQRSHVTAEGWFVPACSYTETKKDQDRKKKEAPPEGGGRTSSFSSENERDEHQIGVERILSSGSQTSSSSLNSDDTSSSSPSSDCNNQVESSGGKSLEPLLLDESTGGGVHGSNSGFFSSASSSSRLEDEDYFHIEEQQPPLEDSGDFTVVEAEEQHHQSSRIASTLNNLPNVVRSGLASSNAALLGLIDKRASNIMKLGQRPKGNISSSLTMAASDGRPAGRSSSAGGKSKRRSKVILTRSYDLSITYDKYYQSPRLWLFGYDENGIPLPAEAVFEDILPEYISKTVTVDPHPCTGVPTVSIHPCQHSSVMKTVVDHWMRIGHEPSHDLALFVLLKMVGSAVPTINYDFTRDVEMNFGPNIVESSFPYIEEPSIVMSDAQPLESPIVDAKDSSSNNSDADMSSGSS